MKPQPIVIVGEALVDVFGTEVLAGGAPFNVARHLGAFGLAPLMITRIGDDATGRLLLDEYARFGLSTAGVQIDPRRASGRVLVTMTGTEHTFDIPGDQSFDHIDSAAALACVAAAGQPACVYHGSLIQREPVSRAALGAVLQGVTAPVFLDLNLRTDSMPALPLEQVIGRPSMVKVNEDELDFLLRWNGAAPLAGTGEAALAARQAALAGLMARLGALTMIVTLGADGALAIGADGACIAREAGIAQTALVDTVGAGDSFASVILAGSMLGWPIGLCLRRATAFSAAICGLAGAVPASLDFYAQWRAEWQL